MKRALLLAVLGWVGVAAALDHPGVAMVSGEGLPVIVNGKPAVSIKVDPAAPKAVHIAAEISPKIFAVCAARRADCAARNPYR